MSDEHTESRTRWDKVERLFDAALDIPEEDRLDWVRDAAAGDNALFRDVVLLLAGHERGEGFLDRPLAIGMATNPLEVIGKALEGRYRIENELGRGGMAVVYLAHEHKHGRQVVLKVLLPGMARTRDIAERFTREVRIIAKLAHPHLIGLIDSGEAAGLLYYVMPFVEGETLRAKLLREGKLPAHEAMPILRDIATGLAYAHQHGVVHRDLKPENVLCAETHAFLMDFGIAKILDVGPRDGSATGEWAVIGTPGYMAPEQHVPGQLIDHRADIYSFGLIAREVLLGQRPIVGGPRLADAGITIDGPAPLPPGIAQLIDDCLQIDPAARPQSAGEVLRRLARQRASGSLAAIPSGKKSRRRAWLLSAGAVAVIGAVAWFSRPQPSRPDLPVPIAVAAFTNQTGDSTLNIWGRMGGDWVTQGLQETGLVSVVPWPVSLLASEQYEAEGQKGTLVDHMKDETGALTIVTGSYYLVGDSLQFRVEATDATAGKLLGAPQPVTVPRDSALIAIRELRQRLMGTVGLLTNEFIGGVNAGDLSRHPPTFDAFVAFDQGIRSSRDQDYPAAADHFGRAYQIDTSFLATLLFQANALANDNQHARMDSVLGTLRARLNELSESHRHWFSFLEATMAGDGARAIEAARRRVAASPAGMGWYNLGLIQLRSGQVKDALYSLGQVDPDRGELRGWSSYWTQLSHAYHMAHDYERELAAARAMATRYPDRRVALVLEARALAVMGRLAELDSALEVSSTQPPTTYWSQGAAMVIAGQELLAHGNREDGRRFLARGINWLRAELALQPTERGHRYWLATALYTLNRWPEAAEIFKQLSEESPTRGDYSWEAALALYRSGADSTEVARWLRPPTPREQGMFATYRGRLALIKGDREAALSIFADALRFGVEGLTWLHASAVPDFEMLGEMRSRMPAGILP
jgi:tRNA A-37 threonylcarbamoyl transferase component Bud32